LDRLSNFADLSPFKELLYQKLVDAIIETKRHFEVSDHRYDDSGFFARHVRAKLRELLEPLSDEYNFIIDTTSGSFVIRYKHFVIKLYKAYNGLFPPLNKENKARIRFINHNRNFFAHLELPGFEGLGGAYAGLRVHLFAYYDVMPSMAFSWLRIACPRCVISTGIDWDWDNLVQGSAYPIDAEQNDYLLTERPDIPYTLIDDNSAQIDGLSEDEDNDTSTELG
jgi:hypothetical protein